MSQNAGRSDQQRSPSLESGLEALRRSPEFRGPIEPLDEHEHANDHFALIYETDEELFTAAVPFVRQGLERDEQCIYVLDDRSKSEVVEALRAAGIDVDDALQAGALTFRTVQETYLRNEPFDPDEMISFYDDTIDRALEEYEGLRVIAGMNWLEEVPFETFLEYEGRVNAIFDETDSMALCHYNRNQHSTAVIRDVIETHPHLIYDGTVCHNFYYTPPEELFGPDRPTNEVNRMLRTLQERTEAKTALEERQRHLRTQTEIVASPDRSFEEKLQALFELGCDRFDLDLGAVAKIDAENDWFEIEYVSTDHDHFEPGIELPLSETYCTAVANSNGAESVANPQDEGYDDIHVYQEFGIRAYLGTYIRVDGGTDRTFFFTTSDPDAEDFSADDHAFIRSMGQWVKYELERRRREEFLRESYQLTSDPDIPFDEKLEELLGLGREWFGLEMAAVSRLPSWDRKFRLEKGLGLDVAPEEEPFWTDPGEGCFCRLTITEDRSVSQVDVRGTDWAHDPIYEELGLTSYLGTKVMSGSTPYGTLWFGSTEPRDRPFSDTECTFIELMGQWVSYEIERREHRQAQRELYEIAADTERTIEEKLQALFELGCDRFGHDLGGMARIDPATDRFEVEHVSGDHDHLEPGAQVALSETYCRLFSDGGNVVGITDPVEEGFDGTLAYDEFGVKSYLGTRISVDDGNDRTLFFVSSEPRNSEASEAERTFLHLMGQWVQHELERTRYEQELEETIDQLRQSNDRLKQFAYAASHDLQEPLRMVSSYLQRLENRHEGDLDADAQQCIDFAVDGADRMRAMVDDLLAFSRVEHADREFEPVDCDAVLDRVRDDLQVRIEETDAELTVESLPTVMGDPEQLEQLFGNLVSNAIKYNEADHPRIDITADQRADHWQFTVTDNGIGIDPEQTDRIFEVFKRLHHEKEYPGTGIGLSLCQEIVDNHGGDIWVESEPGEGSTFFITLPGETVV